jgi:hypothetical protein
VQAIKRVGGQHYKSRRALENTVLHCWEVCDGGIHGLGEMFP